MIFHIDKMTSVKNAFQHFQESKDTCFYLRQMKTRRQLKLSGTLI